MMRSGFGRVGVRMLLAAGLVLTLSAQSCHLNTGTFWQDVRTRFHVPTFLRPARPAAAVAPQAAASVTPAAPCPDGSDPFQVSGGAAVCPPPEGDGCPGTALPVSFPAAEMAMCVPAEIAPAAACGGAMTVAAEDGRSFCFAPGPVDNVCPVDTTVVFGADAEKVVGCIVSCPVGEGWDPATGCAPL